jgi:hypothetical protein
VEGEPSAQPSGGPAPSGATDRRRVRIVGARDALAEGEPTNHLALVATTVNGDQYALATTLHDVFAIDPEALGADRIARLWRQACAQHEAFVSATQRAQEPPRSASI